MLRDWQPPVFQLLILGFASSRSDLPMGASSSSSMANYTISWLFVSNLRPWDTSFLLGLILKLCSRHIGNGDTGAWSAFEGCSLLRSVTVRNKSCSLPETGLGSSRFITIPGPAASILGPN